MKSFTDNLGRVWVVTVNVGTIKLVRALCGVDLTEIVRIGANDKPDFDLVSKISEDPVLLVDILYAICKTQCDTLKITADDFAAGLGGDVIATATDVFLDEVLDFFPKARREPMKAILQAGRRAQEKLLATMPETIDVEAMADEIVKQAQAQTKLSMSAPESAV